MICDMMINVCACFEWSPNSSIRNAPTRALQNFDETQLKNSRQKRNEWEIATMLNGPSSATTAIAGVHEPPKNSQASRNH